MPTLNKHFIVAAIASLCLYGSFFTVDAGHTGVVTQMGAVQQGSYPEGVHLKIPLIQSAHEINTKTLTYAATGLDASTKDLQSVTSDMAVLYSIDSVNAASVYRNYRDSETLEARAIKPSIEEVMKAVTAQYTAEKLITERAKVRSEIISMMRTKLKAHYVTINDISVTNFKFSPAFNQAIEQKVTAEQRSLKAQNDLTRIQIEGQQAIATAKANAESIRVQAEAIQKQGGADYVKLQFINKWDGKLPVYGEVPTMLKTVQ